MFEELFLGLWCGPEGYFKLELDLQRAIFRDMKVPRFFLAKSVKKHVTNISVVVKNKMNQHE